MCRCYGEESPMEDHTETVVFRSFYEKGFALPAGPFFHGLFFFYGLEATHLKPNSIAQIAIFVHLCKAYLGIAPTSIYGGRCTTSRGTCPTPATTWWVAPPSHYTRADHIRPWSSAIVTRGGTRSGSWCRTRLLVCLLGRPRARVPRVLGGVADRGGNGSGDAPP